MARRVDQPAGAGREPEPFGACRGGEPYETPTDQLPLLAPVAGGVTAVALHDRVTGCAGSTSGPEHRS